MWTIRDTEKVNKIIKLLNQQYNKFEQEYKSHADSKIIKYYRNRPELLSNKHFIRAVAEFPSLELLLFDALQINKELKTMMFENDRNIGMVALANKLNNLALASVKDEKLSTHQDKNGYNMGVYATIFGNNKVALETFKNPTALEQLDNDGCNIGIVASIFNNNEIALEALKHKDLVFAQDKDGFNMLMWAVASEDKSLAEVVKKGLEMYPEIDKQKNNAGDNITSLLLSHKYNRSAKIAGISKKIVKTPLLPAPEEQMQNQM